MNDLVTTTGLETCVVALGWATLYTAGAAVLAVLLLRGLRVTSPRAHRVVWSLVVAQGWLVVPLTLEFEVQRPTVAAEEAVDPLEVSAAEWATDEPDVAVDATPQRRVLQQAGAVPNEQPVDVTWHVTALIALWSVGLVAIVVRFTRWYVQLVRHVPLGEPPGRADRADEWAGEWRQLVERHQVGGRVALRIDRRLGPLLCYVPFGYFVLVPQALWTALAGAERRAILRHELAHLVRGDLWSSLAVRAAALPQWFNPAVWYAVRRFEEASEWAADDLAHGGGTEERISYAKALVALSEMMVGRSAASVSARGGRLTERVRRLVNPAFKEERKMKRWIAIVSMALLCVAHVVRVELVAKEPADEAAGGSGSKVVRPTGEEKGEKAEGKKEARKKVEPPSATKDEQDEKEPHNSGEVTPDMLAEAGLAPYRIDAPDVLAIKAVKLVPGKSYKISVGDKFFIGEELDSNTGLEFKEFCRVTDDGTVKLPRILGSDAGKVALKGLTIEEAVKEIQSLLRKKGHTGEASIDSVLSAILSQAGERFLVHPDGTIKFGIYGNVNVAGMTEDEAESAVEKQLANWFEKPDVGLHVYQYNSKSFYVIKDGHGSGDEILRVPCMGNETVLDAIATAGAKSIVSPHDVYAAWVARPDSHRGKHDRILPVDWQGIINGDSQTNHQLLPGDRVFVKEAVEVYQEPAEPPAAPEEAAEVPAAVEVPDDYRPHPVGTEQPVPAPLPGEYYAAAPAKVEPGTEAEFKNDTIELKLQPPKIVLTVGSEKTVKSDVKISRVTTENPEIVKVEPLAPRKLRIRGTAAGVTKVTLYADEDGQHTVNVVVTGDVAELQNEIRRKFKSDGISVSLVGDKIQITGRVKRPQDIAMIQAMAEGYAPRVVNLLAVGDEPEIITQCHAIEFTSRKRHAMDVVRECLPGMLESGVLAGAKIDVQKLRANLDQHGTARMITAPTIHALANGHEFTIQSGGEVPVIKSQGDDLFSIEYRPLGTQLKLTPLLVGDDLLRLLIRVRLGEIDPKRTTIVQGQEAPALKVRQMETNLKMKLSQSVVMVLPEAVKGAVYSDPESAEAAMKKCTLFVIKASVYRGKQPSSTSESSRVLRGVGVSSSAGLTGTIVLPRSETTPTTTKRE